MLGFRTKSPKADIFEQLFGRSAPRRESVPAEAPTVNMEALAPYTFKWHDGDKFYGGFGDTQFLVTDYWTLRARSSQLFATNLYARGLIRRLITNELNTGLHLEATPEEKILGEEEDALADWSEDVENRFALWGKDPYLCDISERSSFGALQQAARMEALISGDVLVVLRQNPATGLPRVQLISGSAVQTPWNHKPRPGVKIKHGVEVDSLGRHVAFWIRQEDNTFKRLPAWGEKSQRRLAWLVYGCEKRLDEVRGTPLLALVLQSLREIDRYRDSTQRKAAVLAMLAMYIKKGEAAPGTRPITGGAVRRTVVETTGDGVGKERAFHTSEHIPGLVIDELQHGEEPAAFQTQGTTEAFGVFEEAVLSAVAWGHEMPPEILRLAFSSNYSASQAAINEFKSYLNKVRTFWGESFCAPVYEDWLISMALLKKIQQAQRLLTAWRDARQYETYNALRASDWTGNIKPAVDVSKLAAGYEKMIEMGTITRDRASRELTGTKFSKNVQKLRRENELLAEANRPIKELEASAKAASGPPPPNDSEEDERENEERADANVAVENGSSAGHGTRVEVRPGPGRETTN